MTILHHPVPSRSFRSWEVIAGGPQMQLCVQERTCEGMRKNKRIVHRLFYGEADLKKYRIIRSSNRVDYQSMTDGSGRNIAEESTGPRMRLVLATSDSRDEIMRDWDELKAKGMPPCGGNWGLGVSQQSSASSIGHQGSELSPFQRSPVCPNWTGIGGSHLAWENATEYSPLSDLSASPQFTCLPVQGGSSADAYDACLIRIMEMWDWTHPFETAAYVTVVAAGWWCQVLQWSFIFIISLVMGLLRCRQFMTEKEEREGKARILYVTNFLVMNVSKNVIHFVSGVVCLHWLVVWLAPQWTLINIFEHVIPPLIIASLLHTGFRRLIGTPLVRRTKPLSSKTESAASCGFNYSLLSSGSNVCTGAFSGHNSGSPVRREANAAAGGTAFFGERCDRNSLANRQPSTPSLRSREWLRGDGLVGDSGAWERSGTTNTTTIFVEVDVPQGSVNSLQAVLANAVRSERQGNYFFRCNKTLSRQTLVSTKDGSEFTLSTVYMLAGARESLRTDTNASCGLDFPVGPQQGEQSAVQSLAGAESSAESPPSADPAIKSMRTPITLPSLLGFAKDEGLLTWSYDIAGSEREDGSLRLRACYTITSSTNLPESTRHELTKQLSCKADAIVELLGTSGAEIRTAVPKEDRQRTTSLHVSPVRSAVCTTPPAHVQDGVAENIPKCEENNGALQIAEYVIKEIFLKCKWDFVSQKKGATLWTADTQWSDKKAVKVVVHIPRATLADVDSVVNDPHLVSVMDNMVEAKVLVRKVSSDVHIYHTKFSSPFWGISARDVVTRTAVSFYPSEDQRVAMGLEGGKPMFLHTSVDAPSEVPTLAGFVRARVFAFGVLAEVAVGDDGLEGVRVTRCIAADPEGLLPGYVVNALSVMQLDSILTFAKFVKKRARASVSGAASQCFGRESEERAEATPAV
ncbi:hypothetical protein, conserved [Trypanosoma brucei brucei TREU927]|uniref:START domain-containing protein n=1 Tax=Trypanosoma brucei brucei (strain 927/4 GUTat10.1) TaxID=185431 RepID=Q384X9_TRYB2|nr:hypothetical protein, conserved [Trypanosoma brucei brucei TREU927]EAN79652.1 hypothetical protein, conserved [Trypanosoma brucei brucei TREU927]